MKAHKSGDEIRLDGAYIHKESIKEVSGHRYDAQIKAWFIPCNEKNAALVQMLGAELDTSLDAFVGAVCETAQADETHIRKMPIKAKPYKHQVRAFNFAMRLFGGE